MAPTAHMHGLTSAAAAERLARYGPNALPEHPPLPLWRRFARQFNSPLIYVLLFALAFDLTLWAREPAHGWPIEAAAIAVILLLNAILGTYQEQRSERALARLAMLAGPHAWVVRDGRLVHLPTSDVVPDDWVRLEAGDRIPADGVLQEAHATLLDESMLTGESLPVEKALADTVFSGTLLVRGKAMLRVTQTGPLSTMGRLATMLGGIQLTRTPLERRLAVLGRQVAIAVGALAILIAALGTITEGLSGLAQIVLFAVALAVAAVPEGLPAVVTVALSLGVDRMARARAVVRRLAAVEALGSVTVIATDKTGTLTENRMEVRALDSTDPHRALVAMTLANDADLAAGSGDPLDLGLLRYAAAQGVDVEALRAHHIRVQERTFDSAWKFARVTVRATEGVVSYVKGAPEVVLERCDLSRDDRASWAEKIAAYGAQGLRVLALACAPGIS